MKITPTQSASKVGASVIGAILLILAPLASSTDASCDGYTTSLYANEKTVLTICHGPYTKIDKRRVEQWQSCDDAVLHIKNKKSGHTIQYADCLSESGKQFRVQGDVFMLRHFQTTYPGFETEPLLIESLDLRTNKKVYKFEKQFLFCSRKDVDAAVQQVDSTTAKPFDGKMYFSSVYGGFYKLRDCAKNNPSLVLSILRRYQMSDYFDGEVAETLNSVTEEVEIIHGATGR